MNVKFAQSPNIDSIRHELDRAGLRNATIQGFGPASDHAVIIGLDLQTTTSSNALDTGKQAIVTSLSDLYGKGPEGKTDFNNASPQTVADHLTADDPLGVGAKGLDAATKTYRDLADAMVNYRNAPPRSGLLADLNDLRNVPGVTPAVISALTQGLLLVQLRHYEHQNRGAEGGLRPAPPSPLRNPGGPGRNVDLHLVSF